MKGNRFKGWGSSYQARGQSGWEFATMSKKLAFQVSRGSLLLCKGFNLTVICILCRYRLTVDCVIINEILVCRLKINHAWSALSSCVLFLGTILVVAKQFQR